MKTSMTFADAVAAIRKFRPLIEDCCDTLVIAGSIRRRKPNPSDVEIVAVPRIEQRSTDMFSEFTTAVDVMHERMLGLLEQGTVIKRPRSDGKTLWGPRAKYLVYDGVPIDLFTPEAERLGIILMIRTGPWGYSRRMVTPTDQTTVVGYRPGGKPILGKGLMPKHMRVAEGWLTYRTSGQKIPTPTEQSVYDLYGLPYAEPWSRQ